MPENYSLPKKRCFCLKLNNLAAKPKQIYGWNKNKSQMEIDNEHEIEDKSSNNAHHFDGTVTVQLQNGVHMCWTDYRHPKFNCIQKKNIYYTHYCALFLILIVTDCSFTRKIQHLIE